MFGLLILLGLSTFAPCVLLPEWREYQQLRSAEQAEQHRLDEMRRHVEREKNLLEGMQTDPAVIARVARRDLHFYQPGETAVAVDVPVVDPNVPAPFVAGVPEPPVALARIGKYLPDFRYDALFCEPKTRRIVMLLSIGLIATAMTVFWKKPVVRA